MKFQLKKAEQSVILTVFIQDSSAATGAGLGSLDQTSSIVGGYVKRDGTGVALAVDENVTTEGTYEAPSTAAQVRIGTPANMTTGVYELHFHNDLFTTADWITISLGGAANMAPLLIEVQLTDIDMNTTPIAANVTQISGDSTAADNLESQYDTTGLSGGTFPANQDQLGNIANTGAAINKVSAGASNITGTPTNTYTATQALDGVYHSIVPAGTTISVDYNFNIGGTGVPVSATISGRLFDPPATSDVIEIYAYDWVAAGFVQVGTLDGVNSGTDAVKTVILFANHVGTGANAGEVDLRFNNTSIDAGTILYIDLLYVSYSVVSSSVGYANGAIWIDTVNGTAGTAANVNGTADNPVDTLADALTLSASLGIPRFEVAPKSALTFAQDMDGFTFHGSNYSIDMAGYDTDSLLLEGATVTGALTATGSVGMLQCRLSDGATLPSGGFGGCTLPGDITLSGTFYLFDQCISVVSGTSSPSIDLGAVGAQSVNFRHYSGGIEVKNMSAGDTMSLEGDGQLIINSSCDGGTIAIRGNFTVTDNASAAVTLSDDARFDIEQPINTALITTVATANSTTIFPLSAGTPVDDAYNAMTITVTDADGNGSVETRRITDWTSGRVVTVDTAFSFTPATGDAVVIRRDYLGVEGAGTSPTAVWAHASRTLTPKNVD